MPKGAVPSAGPAPWRPRLGGERRAAPRPRRKFLLGGASPRERRLGLRLDVEISSIGVVMHGCRLGPGSERIDHLVVVPSGVWVIVADHDDGASGFDGRGGAGAERFAEVDRSADLVRGVLVEIDMDWVDVVPALCFTNKRVRTSTVDGIHVVSARRLVRQVGRRGALLQADARRVAGAIGRELVVDGDPLRRAAAPLDVLELPEAD